MGLSTDQIYSFLSQRPPRYVPASVRRKALQKAGLSMIFFGLLFGGFGVPFVSIFFPWRIIDDVRLKSSSALTTSGRIEERTETGMSENDRHVFQFDFSFRANDGREYTGTSYRTGGGPDKDSEVKIAYLPDNPAICTIQGYRTSQFGWGGGFVIIFPLIGFGIVFFTVRSILRTQGILKNGFFAMGTVESVESTNMRVNNQVRYKVTIGFDDIHGRRQTSTCNAYGRDADRARQRRDENEKIGVLYNPGNVKHIFLANKLTD